MTLTLDLLPELDRLLGVHAGRNGRTKAELAEHAIAEYIEDLEDYAAAERALASFDPAETRSLEEVIAELGLDIEDHAIGGAAVEKARPADSKPYRDKHERNRAA